MFPSYLPVKAPDPGAYHFNFLGHNQKCLTEVFRFCLLFFYIYELMRFLRFYPSATSKIIMITNPAANPMVPAFECFP